MPVREEVGLREGVEEALGGAAVALRVGERDDVEEDVAATTVPVSCRLGLVQPGLELKYKVPEFAMDAPQATRRNVMLALVLCRAAMPFKVTAT